MLEQDNAPFFEGVFLGVLNMTLGASSLRYLKLLDLMLLRRKHITATKALPQNQHLQAGLNRFYPTRETYGHIQRNALESTKWIGIPRETSGSLKNIFSENTMQDLKHSRSSLKIKNIFHPHSELVSRSPQTPDQSENHHFCPPR